MVRRSLPATPMVGAHRLTLSTSSVGGVDDAVRLLELVGRDISDRQALQGYDPAHGLAFLGGDASKSRCIAYLSGSIHSWIAMSAARLPVPVLDHAELSAREFGWPLTDILVESRVVVRATPFTPSMMNLPFSFHPGSAMVSRIRMDGPPLTTGQLEGLARHLEVTIRQHLWMNGRVPSAVATFVDAQAISLSHPIPSGMVIETVALAISLFWLDIARVECE